MDSPRVSVPIASVSLRNFKAFESFTLHLPSNAVIVGPNNAGKSTLLRAIRACGHMVRHAKSRSADAFREDGGVTVHGYSLSGDAPFGLTLENLRHEFRGVESRIEIRWKNGSRITVVWPESESTTPGAGFFYLRSGADTVLTRPKAVRAVLPSIGVVPTLGPVRDREPRRASDYVQANLDRRLASQHFRNQLLLLSNEAPVDRDQPNRLREYFTFVQRWTPEFGGFSLDATDADSLNLFYRDVNERTERELAWAGDGYQVWLQVLLHVFRSQGVDTLVLDEPDVYLHSDVQRRLIRVLEASQSQTILATHSPDIVAEADPSSVLIIDKARRRAVRPPDNLGGAADALGTQFNLRIARALRAKLVLFVEGKDAGVLRVLAERLGLTHIANEAGVAIIRLDGFSNWPSARAFGWISKELLAGTVPVHVLLDRDYRSDAQCDGIEAELRGADVRGHIWRRKELESYLLEPVLLARVARLPQAWVEESLDALSREMRDAVVARVLDERARYEVSAARHRVDVFEQASREVDERWGSLASRLALCPPKSVLSSMNARLQAEGASALSFPRLAKAIRPNEIAQEVVDVLESLEQAVL